MSPKTSMGYALQTPWLACLALLALLGLAARPAAAAIAVADSDSASTPYALSSTISHPFTVNSGNVLVVNFSWRGINGSYPVLPTSLTWGSQTMTRAAEAGQVAAKAYGSAVYYLWNPNPGSSTISGSFTSPGTFNNIISAFTLTGVDTNVSPIVATNIDQSVVNSSITSFIATNVAPGSFAALCAGSAGTANGSGFSASPPGLTPINWLQSGFAGGYWDQGYISGLGGGDTTFSCGFVGAQRMHIVAAVFTPGIPIQPQPVLDVPKSSGRSSTGATLGAIVLTNSGSTIDDYGILYSETALNPNPTVGGNMVQMGTVETIGSFSGNVTGLTPGTQYSFAGYAHNANGYGYSPVGTFYTLVAEPTVQASGVAISGTQRSAYQVSWTRGDGENCIVVARISSVEASAPVDGTTYTANTTFGLGSQTGNGNYVVYVGSSNSVVLSGLTVNTNYHVSVYEVNGAGGTVNYLTPTSATNSASASTDTYYSAQTGLSPVDFPTWTNIVGANPVNFSGGDIFIIQNGHALASAGPWTIFGGAKLIINSGGSLDMQYDVNKLSIGGSFVNNGTFAKSVDTATPPSVNFTSDGTLTLGTNYNASVVAVGGGGGGAGANTTRPQGGGGGGGGSASALGVRLQANNVYLVTAGASGPRGTGGGPSAGSAGGDSVFGGGFVVPIVAGGGAGGSIDTNTAAGGAAGSGGFAGGTGSATGGGGGGAGNSGAGTAASGGSGGAGGAGTVLQGGIGGSIAVNANGGAGASPGGGGAGANSTSLQVGGGLGGAGQVTVVFNATTNALDRGNWEYRSRANGSWNSISTWSVNKATGIFVNASTGEIPTAGHKSVLVSNHTVTVSTPEVAVNLTVSSNSTLTVSGGGSLNVNRVYGQTNANNLAVYGTLNLASTSALRLGVNTTNLIAAGAVLNQTAAAAVSAGTGVQLTINGSYVQNVTGSGKIPVATWGAASTCTINSTFTNSIDAAANADQLNYNQTFVNFIWNAQGGTTNVVYRMMTDSTATNWNVGNLTISNTAGTPAQLELTGTQPLNTSVTNLTMTGGLFRAGGGGSALTVNGALAISGNSTVDTGGTITALDNLSITGTADVTGNARIRFAKAGAQSWTVTTTNELLGPGWTVNSGSAVTLGSASQCVVNDLTVNGTLAVSGSSTLIVNGTSVPSTNNAGSITVASGSTLGGNGAIGASVTLSAGALATNAVSFGTNGLLNSKLTLTNALAVNGNSIHVSTGTNVLAAGDYLLITNDNGGITGSFASAPVLSGAGLDAGLTATVVTTANAVTLHVVAPSSGEPVITSTRFSGGSLIISGINSGGNVGGTYYVRASTNVVLSVTNWPRISTNTYGVGGAFSVTNQVIPGATKNFFLLEQ